MAEILLMTYEILQDHNSWVTGDDILVYVDTADNSKRVVKNTVDITSGDIMNNYDAAQVSYTRNSDYYVLDNGDVYKFFSFTEGKSGIFPYLAYNLQTNTSPVTTQKLLHKFEFRENTGTWTTSDKVETFWDTTTETIVVKKNGTVITSGDNIPSFTFTSGCANELGIGCENVVKVTDYQYSFCDGVDLVRFFKNLAVLTYVFPYSLKDVVENSPVCNASTCDILFTSVPVVVEATGSGNSDGTITVTAESSGANIEYGLGDFTYGTGQINGVFTSLFPGSYRVYAKDASGCGVYQDVTVGVNAASSTYGVKYRLTYYQDNSYYYSKVDILELGYEGAVIEVTGAQTPFIVSWNGDGDLDKFKPITAASATIGLVNETSQGHFYFDSILTSDERQYKVKKYIDNVLEWEGFIIPYLSSEPYIDTPYDVYFTATDGLADLDNEDFEDKDGNKITSVLSLIKVLSVCLKKTDLNFNIRVGCNLYETNHNQTATDDPFAQTFVDCAAYEGLSCKQVVEAIVKPFRARLFAVDGYFYIVRSQEQISSFEYREFDINGNYLSNGTINPIEDIKAASFSDRSVFLEQSAVKEILPSYRKITINQLLGPKDTLISNGDFEDFIYNPNAVLINPFPDWFLKLNGNSGTYLLETKGRSGERAVRFFGGSFTDPENFPYIESKAYPIQWSDGDKIKFSVYYFVDAYPGIVGDTAPKWAKFKYSVSLGAYYLKGNGTWTTDSNQRFITKFIESPNTGWQSLEIIADTPSSSGSGDLIISLQESFLKQSAYDDLTDLKTQETHNKAPGFITWAYYTEAGSLYDTTYLGYYKLKLSSEAESLPDIVRPNDYANFDSGKTYLYSFATGNNQGNTTLVVKQSISLGLPQPGSLNVFDRIYYYTSYTGSTFTLSTPLEENHNEDDPVTVGLNPVVWEKIDEEVVSKEGIGGYLGQYEITRFDDVVFQYLPDGEEPISEKKISIVNNVKIKNDYEDDYFHGDLHNSSSARYIYQNYFRLSDGTPTGQWKRDEVSEATEILKIALKVMAVEYGSPTRKISGDMLADSRVTILNTLRETFDSNRKYIISGMTINDKEGTYNFEMYELANSADGDSGGGGSTYNGDFNADFGAQFDTVLN